jgi:hypothetical protein
LPDHGDAVPQARETRAGALPVVFTSKLNRAELPGESTLAAALLVDQ